MIKKDFSRLEKIKKYREQRVSLPDIGKLFGISRQRVYQILNDYRSPYSRSRKFQEYKNKWGRESRKKLKVVNKKKLKK